jgi:uncharacterized protein YqfA (UPF0365 family)
MNWSSILALSDKATAALVIIGLIVFIILMVFAYFFKVWVRALMSGARVTISSLVGMKLRKVPPLVVVDGKIMAVKAGM